MKSEGKKDEYGLVRRGRISAVLGVSWVAFLVLWLFFFAPGYDIYKNIAIVVTSLLIVGALMSLTWMIGVKFPKGCMKAIKEVKGLGWRMLLSMIVMATSIVFFLVWFYFYAVDFSGYQNVAILIVQILATIGVLAATWATFKTEDDGKVPEGMPDWCSKMSGQVKEGN
jgi:hypothetical protein